MADYLDIVLPVYNCPDLEDRCVRALLMPGGLPDGARILMVDDASPDMTTANTWGRALAALGHVFHRHGHNRGCHAAWNSGLSLARPDADVVLLGSDVVVAPFVIERLWRVGMANGFGVLGATDVTSDAWHPSMMFRLIDMNTNENRVLRDRGISSCCVLSRQALDAVGVFDDQFLMTFGDTDWNERARDAGIQMGELQNAVVFHGGSVSRKRLGAESDLEKDRADHRRFLEKWRNRPDVLERHSMTGDDSVALAVKQQCWREGET